MISSYRDHVRACQKNQAPRNGAGKIIIALWCRTTNDVRARDSKNKKVAIEWCICTYREVYSQLNSFPVVCFVEKKEQELKWTSAFRVSFLSVFPASAETVGCSNSTWLNLNWCKAMFSSSPCGTGFRIAAFRIHFWFRVVPNMSTCLRVTVTLLIFDTLNWLNVIASASGSVVNAHIFPF